MITRIHVNQHNIKYNVKNPDEPKPVFTIKFGKKNVVTNDIIIDGPSKVVYRPDKPLSCGARVWIETRHAVFANGNEVNFPDPQYGE